MADIEVFTLQYNKADLEAAPDTDRVFFLMITQLANDLQILWKQMLMAFANPPEGVINGQAASTVAMLNLRLLCGRLAEGGRTLHMVFRAIREDYEPHFSGAARTALADLYTLFDDRDNLIKKVRDKVGFHADVRETLEAFAALPADVALGDYLALTINNTLYWSAAVINDAVLRNLTGADQANALQTVMALSQETTSLFNTVAFAYTRVFAERYLRTALDDLQANRETVPDVQALHELRLPFFIQILGIAPQA
jgi:hypothetical protein